MKKPKDEYYYKCPHGGIGNNARFMLTTCEPCQKDLFFHYEFNVLQRQLREKAYTKVSNLKGKGTHYIEVPLDSSPAIVDRRV